MRRVVRGLNGAVVDRGRVEGRARRSAVLGGEEGGF